jgi:hypothetical protein
MILATMRNRPGAKPRGRLFRSFERAVLGFGMTLVAYFLERRLIKALKKGRVEPAPRTAAGPGEETVSAPGEGGLTAASHEVGYQSGG